MEKTRRCEKRIQKKVAAGAVGVCFDLRFRAWYFWRPLSFLDLVLL